MCGVRRVEPDDGGGQCEGASVHLPYFNLRDGCQKGEVALPDAGMHLHNGRVWDGVLLVECTQQLPPKLRGIPISCIHWWKKSSWVTPSAVVSQKTWSWWGEAFLRSKENALGWLQTTTVCSVHSDGKTVRGFFQHGEQFTCSRRNLCGSERLRDTQRR